MTNWFEVHYTQLLDYAYALVNKHGNYVRNCHKHRLLVQPEDLVSEAYISHVDSDKIFDLTEVKKLILQAAYKEKAFDCQKYKFGKPVFAKEKRITGDMVCGICHETKPVNAFRLIKHQGYHRVTGTCKDCELKRALQWFKDNKERWAAYVRTWKAKKYGKKPKRKAKPIHDLWKKANHKYFEKQRDMLSDVYIKSLLRGKPAGPKEIEMKRYEIMCHRNKTDVVLN